MTFDPKVYVFQAEQRQQQARSGNGRTLLHVPSRWTSSVRRSFSGGPR